ncbi:hypothetical protein BKA65DRAFT_577761 [Rhexocercosporidium sp. MPI-PUGE-AT-0058]|nr:hypothetical protein BKA65DRAFT_577761 [Rhexocercosporidium sp. MPI-PUGE-AT-0058]
MQVEAGSWSECRGKGTRGLGLGVGGDAGVVAVASSVVAGLGPNYPSLPYLTYYEHLCGEAVALVPTCREEEELCSLRTLKLGGWPSRFMSVGTRVAWCVHGAWHGMAWPPDDTLPSVAWEGIIMKEGGVGLELRTGTGQDAATETWLCGSVSPELSSYGEELRNRAGQGSMPVKRAAATIRANKQARTLLAMSRGFIGEKVHTWARGPSRAMGRSFTSRAVRLSSERASPEPGQEQGILGENLAFSQVMCGANRGWPPGGRYRSSVSNQQVVVEVGGW